MKRILLALFALSIAVVRADAAPLDVRQVPSDAAAVGHVDLDALRRSTIMPLMTESVAHSNEKSKPLLTTLLNQCQDVTLWVADGAKPDRTGVLLLSFPTSSDHAGRFMTDLAQLIGAKNIGGSRYTGTMDDGKHFEAVVLGNVVMMSNDTASLDKSIAVAQSKTPSMTEAQLPGGSADRGVFLFVALGKALLADVRHNAGSKLLQAEMSALTLNIGEVGSDMHVRATAVMATPEGAQKVKTVVDGLVAVASLADDSKKFEDLLKYLKVSTSGTTTEVSLVMPSSELVKLVHVAPVTQ